MKSNPTANGDPTFCIPDQHGHCITCSDQALPALVVRLIDPWTAIATIAGEQQEIDITLLDDVQPDQRVLVHGGVALGRADE